MAFDQGVRSVQSALANENYAMAKRRLMRLDARTPTENRIRGFWASQIHVREGKYALAVGKLRDTRAQFGDHVSLVVNLAHCYYQLEDFATFHRTLEELQIIVRDFGARMSLASLVRATLSLGKFLEEEGKVSEARGIYESALARVDSSEKPEEYYQLLAQIVRLSAAFGATLSDRKYFKQLSRLKEQSPNLYLSIEVQHAVMLATVALVGPAAASELCREVLARKNLRTFDRRLLYFDYLEETLVHYGIDSVAEKPTAIVPGDTFEKALDSLLELLRGGAAPVSAQLKRLEKNLSPASFLRVLILHLKYTPDAANFEELARLFELSVLALESPASIAAWNRRLETAMRDRTQATPLKIILRTDRNEIRVGQNRIDLSKKAILFDLLALMTASRDLPLSAVVRALWDADPNESYYHRLRNVVQRTNRLFLPALPHGRALELTKRRLRLTIPITLMP